MKISDNLKYSAIDYANQGNSIIGIRGSGKTYTATKIAEQLMLAGIPIIAFDPTGVWQNLRYGIDGGAGYPVVIAGGLHGDIELTEANATQIIKAALTERTSLIIDLQGTSTFNKSKWLRIVSESIEFLMGNNTGHGLRHIFIEEAAEFVPQKPSPGGALCYSRIESMAHIGRNFGLGYTLINQRAEEIAKAVFEISELVLIHRQTGKNSLNSIKDWLLARGQYTAGIVQTLPKLNIGECWAIDNEREVKIMVLPKETLHPDPKHQTVQPTVALPGGLAEIIDRMNLVIDLNLPLSKQVVKPLPATSQLIIDQNLKIIEGLKKENAILSQDNQQQLITINNLKADYELTKKKLGNANDGNRRILEIIRNAVPTEREMYTICEETLKAAASDTFEVDDIQSDSNLSDQVATEIAERAIALLKRYPDALS